MSVPTPTAVAFIPDGRMLVTSQAGQLFSWDGSRRDLVLDLLGRTCSRGEQGMLGVAADPAFRSNRFIYVFYTADLEGDCFNRVSRFTVGPGGGVESATEMLLVDRIPSVGGNHNGGDVQFGKDGLLYISVGDGGCATEESEGCAGGNRTSRDRSILMGKVLRIRPDGGIPPDNPFLGPDSAQCRLQGHAGEAKDCQETFAWGLRNPFRLAFDANAPTTRFRINDPGQDRWEEINEAVAGADYGWNIREGRCANGSATECGPPPEGMTDPIFDYHHGPEPTSCNVVTGGAFVPAGVWPDEYRGAYLFADFSCGSIFRLVENGGVSRAEPFVSGLGEFGVVDLDFGLHGSAQALYYTTFSNGGELRRIGYARDAKPAL